MSAGWQHHWLGGWGAALPPAAYQRVVAASNATSAVVNHSKRLKKTLQAASTGLPTVRKQVHKTFQGASSSASSVRRSASKRVTAVSPSSGGLRREVSKHVTALSAGMTSLGRQFALLRTTIEVASSSGKNLLAPGQSSASAESNFMQWGGSENITPTSLEVFEGTSAVSCDTAPMVPSYFSPAGIATHPATEDTKIVAPNTSVVGSLWVKMPAGQEFYTGVQFYTGTNALSKTGRRRWYVGTGDWQFVTTPIESDVVEAKAMPYVIVESGTPTFYVDKLMMERAIHNVGLIEHVDVFEIPFGNHDQEIIRQSANYPPGGGSQTQNTTSVTLDARKQRAGTNANPGNHNVAIVLLSWDTSPLPDDAVVTQADIVAYVRGVDDETKNRSVNIEWFPWVGGNSTADWADVVPSTHFSRRIDTFILNTYAVMGMGSPENVSLMGDTKVRIGISGNAAPAGDDNRLRLDSFEGTLGAPPRLRVTFQASRPRPTEWVSGTAGGYLSRTFDLARAGAKVTSVGAATLGRVKQLRRTIQALSLNRMLLTKRATKRVTVLSNSAKSLAKSVRFRVTILRTSPHTAARVVKNVRKMLLRTSPHATSPARKQVAKRLLHTSPHAFSIRRGVSKRVARVSAHVMALTKSARHPRTILVNSTSQVTRLIGRVFYRTVAVLSASDKTLTRRKMIRRTLLAQSAAAASLQRKIHMMLRFQSAQSAAIAKLNRLRMIIAAANIGRATLRRQVSKTIWRTSTSAMTFATDRVARVFHRAIHATSTSQVTRQLSIRKTLDVASPHAVTVRRAVSKRMTASSAYSAMMKLGDSYVVSIFVGSNSETSIARTTAKRVYAVSTSTARLNRAVIRLVDRTTRWVINRIRA